MSDEELSPHTIKWACKWLEWEHGLTAERALAIISGRPPGQDYLRRNEAISVADFLEHIGRA